MCSLVNGPDAVLADSRSAGPRVEGEVLDAVLAPWPAEPGGGA